MALDYCDKTTCECALLSVHRTAESQQACIKHVLCSHPVTAVIYSECVGFVINKHIWHMETPDYLNMRWYRQPAHVDNQKYYNHIGTSFPYTSTHKKVLVRN